MYAWPPANRVGYVDAACFLMVVTLADLLAWPALPAALFALIAYTIFSPAVRICRELR